MNIIESKMSSDITGTDFQGTLYFLKLNSSFQKDLVVFIFKKLKFVNNIFVLTNGGIDNYKFYEEIISMSKNKDVRLDLLYIRYHLSEGWLSFNELTDYLLSRISEELFE